MYRIFLLVLLTFSACINEEKDILSQEINNWEFKYEGRWYDAQVPGNNFSDLLNHELIPDPFYANNEDSISWVSERDWTYRTKFKLSKNKIAKKNQVLVFYGLDTYAQVFLNDSLILDGNNMFLKWEINVSGILKKKKHTNSKFLFS